MDIQLSEIQPSPNPVRKSWDEEKMQELANSIKEQGVIVPIKVRPTSNSHYEIVYGHRRVEASRRAGLEVVPCNVEGVDDDDSLIQALIENVMREDMNDGDKRDALAEIKSRTNKTWKEVGKMFGWSESRIRQFADMSDEEAEIIKHYHGNVSERYARMSRKAGGEYSPKVLEKVAKEGLSSNQAEKIAESIAVTQDPKMKEALLKAPYSPYTHDPEFNRERAQRYGAHDPMARDKTPPKDTSWRETPEVAVLLRDIADMRETCAKAIKMDVIGKFAPEARPFIASKVKGLIRELQNVVNQLEK